VIANVHVCDQIQSKSITQGENIIRKQFHIMIQILQSKAVIKAMNKIHLFKNKTFLLLISNFQWLLVLSQ